MEVPLNASSCPSVLSSCSIPLPVKKKKVYKLVVRKEHWSEDSVNRGKSISTKLTAINKRIRYNKQHRERCILCQKTVFLCVHRGRTWNSEHRRILQSHLC